jgi:hypothetical protein
MDVIYTGLHRTRDCGAEDIYLATVRVWFGSYA